MSIVAAEFSVSSDAFALGKILQNGEDVQIELTHFVPGGTEDSEPRQYGRLGDLSDSEVRLLNISYAYTLNEAATTAGVTSWEVFVLDEPFAHLDQASTSELLEYIATSDRQFIITASNDTVADKFDDYHTVQLTRGPMQSELGAFL